MKKIMLICAAMAVAGAGFGQRMKISSADSYLKDKEYKKAVSTINEAIASEATKNDPDAWFKRGQIYYAMVLDKDMKAQEQENIVPAVESFNKVLELKPTYNPEYLNSYVASLMNSYYNFAIGHYQASDYTGAYSNFMKVTDLYSKYGGPTRFKLTEPQGKEIAKLVKLSKTYAAEASLASKKYPQMLALYEELTKNKAVPDSELARVYTNMLVGYNETKETDKFATTLESALKKFPENEVFRGQKLNQVFNSGDVDGAITKLEQDVAAKPGDANTAMALAELYRKKAEDLMKDKNSATPSAIIEELLTKSQKNFQASFDVKKDPRVGYQLGYINMMKANNVIENQNRLGTSAAETKKYDVLTIERDKYFAAAVPYLEETHNLLQANPKTNADADLLNLNLTTMRTLRQAYNRIGNDAKQKEMEVKIKALEDANK